MQQYLSMFIPATPVGVQHGPAVAQARNNPSPTNLQANNNPQLAANNPVQIEQVLLIFIPGTPVRVQRAPPADIEPHDIARRLPLAASNLSPFRELSQSSRLVYYDLLT